MRPLFLSSSDWPCGLLLVVIERIEKCSEEIVKGQRPRMVVRSVRVSV